MDSKLLPLSLGYHEDDRNSTTERVETGGVPLELYDISILGELSTLDNNPSRTFAVAYTY
jgi:hypothetical protein